MTMTRKHFELIAATLRCLCENSSYCFDDPLDQESIALWFANELAYTNPSFDADKFVEAALPEPSHE